jgi:hypothetical protein
MNEKKKVDNDHFIGGDKHPETITLATDFDFATRCTW